MKKNKITILLNNRPEMLGEPIQAANEGIKLLLGAWSRDPCWQENLEVEIWLASGQQLYAFQDLKSVSLLTDISCVPQDASQETLEEVLYRLLCSEAPDSTLFYRPQMIILSDTLGNCDTPPLEEAFKHSAYTDSWFLLAGGGDDKVLSLPFAGAALRIEELNPHQACNFICQDELPDTTAPLPERYCAVAERLQSTAKQGDVDAQIQLAGMYRRGLGVKRSPQNAHDWYESAAAQGNTSAMFELGELYWLGLMGIAHKAEAGKWYAKAAAHGNAEAQYRLGIICKFGLGQPRNPSAAFEWWQKAACNEHQAAQHALRQRRSHVLPDETPIRASLTEPHDASPLIQP
ncbi:MULTISPECIES: tetratricopeptide repeat protein [Aeromonas]|uniref:tetratricopeptide repeat protein n=1 Tax=Aeromonas TaxID=642 RepID=UPI002B06185C|nr:tetratricopeptide repeat protein [Aeromonas hydrophila]